MARATDRMTDAAVRNAKPRATAYKLSDGGGLYLLVTPDGGRYWRLKYRHGGRERLLALGVYPEVPLKAARQRRADARALLARGTDPSAARKDAKRKAAAPTFADVTHQWLAAQAMAASTRQERERILERDILPALGGKAIDALTRQDVLAMARRLEARGANYLARRAVQICGQICRYARVHGMRHDNPAEDVTAALAPHTPRHHACVPESELQGLLARVRNYHGDDVTRLGLHLLALTFLRTQELTRAEWSEFDLERRVWTVPAERTKMRRPHVVPLSRQAMEVLAELRALAPRSRFVLPGKKPGAPISQNTLLYALYRMGYRTRMTGHGWRTAASTVLNGAREAGLHAFGPDVIEAQLAHQDRNAIRRAYNRAEYLPERTAMMQWWADYLDASVAKGAGSTPG